MDIDYEAIGKRIQFWRKRRSLTQEQLVLFIEREPAYLSRIEHGNQKPRLDALLRVCSPPGRSCGWTAGREWSGCALCAGSWRCARSGFR